jgi:probable HAF family extracellular repeat protein
MFVGAAAAQTYSITDLGALSGFTSTYAADNNNLGLVTGCSDNSLLPTVPCTTNLPSEAFLWSSGVMQPLGNLPGNDQSIGYVVNDSSEVVGWSGNTQTGNGHGFFWSQTDGMVDLKTLPGGDTYSLADAINSKGVIVGQSLVSNGDVDMVIWTKNKSGKYQIHDKRRLPNAPYCYALDINEHMQVTGTAYFNFSGTKYHGFLWSSANGWMNLQPLPGGKNSEGIWLTDSGVIAGLSTSAKYPNGVSVYWDATGIHSIGTLTGGTSSSPGYISNKLEILGQSTVAGGGNHAYIWTKAKRMRDLNNMIPKNSGWVLVHASSINTAGQIVGYGTINGEGHGFLLTPW